MRVTEKWREQIEKGLMPERVSKTYIPEVSASEDGGIRKAAFVVSTGAEDRDGDVVNPSGWVLDHYRKNPVVLWAHDVKSLPIARAESIVVEGGKLKSVTVFPEKGIHPFADTVYGLVKGGFLKGTSVGFHPIEAAPRKGKTKGIDFNRQELYEFSLLPIPSNREALVEAKSAGYDIDLVVKWASDFLDYAEANGLWIPKFQIEKALAKVLPVSVTVPAVPPAEALASTPEGHATAGAVLSDEEVKGLFDIISGSEPEVLKFVRPIPGKKGKWGVYSHEGKLLGEHDSEESANEQLRAIEANKHSAAPEGVTKEDDMDVVQKLADDLFGEDVKKAAPPWAQEGQVQADEDGKVNPDEAAKAAREAAQAQNEAAKGEGEGEGGKPGEAPAGGDPTEQDPQLAGILDDLARGLLMEIAPLKQGGDPTQVATGLKAALEKFAAAFMQTYVVPAAQAAPPGAPPAPPAAKPATPPPAAAPKPPAPPAAPKPAAAPAAAPAPAPAEPKPAAPPFPPKKPEYKGIEGFEGLSADDISEVVRKVVKRQMDEERMKLTGKLPDSK